MGMVSGQRAVLQCEEVRWIRLVRRHHRPTYGWKDVDGIDLRLIVALRLWQPGLIHRTPQQREHFLRPAARAGSPRCDTIAKPNEGRVAVVASQQIENRVVRASI